MRDGLGLGPGTELELRVVDRRIEIEVPSTRMRLENGEHGLVAAADRDMPVLITDMVLADRPRLPAHAGLEVYSVLTRLPEPFRAEPPVVAEFPAT